VAPSPPPLRTARASCPACRSSRWTGSDAVLVSLALTCGLEPWEVPSVVTAPGVPWDEGMELDLLVIEPGLSTPRTSPTLGFGYPIERAAFGPAWTPPLEAPASPIRFQGGIVRARAAFHLHVADEGNGRPPFASETEGLATSIPTFRIERGAVLPPFDGSALDPPLRFLGVPAFHPTPQRSPDGVVHLLEGVLAHHMAVVQGPAADARVQMAQHDFCGDGLMGFPP
jgi:hypothetical protein